MLARDAQPPLKRTPLHALHVARGGKMVPFAGYEMPVQYAAGVLKEHLHTRAAAGLFDVSHMGQIALRPKSGKVEDARWRWSGWCRRISWRSRRAAALRAVHQRQQAASSTT